MNLRLLRENLILESMGGEKTLWVIYKGVRKAGGSHEAASGGIMALAAYHSPLNAFNEAGVNRMCDKFKAEYEGDQGIDTTGAIDAEFTSR